MAPTQSHSPPQGLSVWYVPFQNILPHAHSFKAHICVYINRARLLCDLLLSHKETFSLQDAEVYLICLYLKKPLLMWIFGNVFSPFSIVSIRVVSDGLDFYHCHHGPLWQGLLVHEEHFSRQRCGAAVGKGMGILHCHRHCQVTFYKHHDRFRTYQRGKRCSSPCVVWLAFLWWLVRLRL